jgi:hypothetical protein
MVALNINDERLLLHHHFTLSKTAGLVLVVAAVALEAADVAEPMVIEEGVEVNELAADDEEPENVSGNAM